MNDRQEAVSQGFDALDAWLSGLRLGEPATDKALSLVPVYAEVSTSALRYRTLAAAIAAGEVLVTEAPQATVPTLQLINQSALPVLVIDGEEVVGGKQNRVVNTSLLVPPKTIFDLPVSCVEHGRWHDVQAGFDAGETAYPRLRSQKLEQVAASYAVAGAPAADQGAVWDEVAEGHRRTGARSTTGAMRDAYVERGYDLADAEERFRCPTDRPLGVIALVGGRAACADIFDQPETLAGYWPRLVRSYALEALEERASPPSLDSARRLLARPLKARRTAYRSPGLGRDVRIAGNGVLGAVLVCEDVAVHTALFRRRRSPTNGPSIRRPSQRARRYER